MRLFPALFLPCGSSAAAFASEGTAGLKSAAQATAGYVYEMAGAVMTSDKFIRLLGRLVPAFSLRACFISRNIWICPDFSAQRKAAPEIIVEQSA